MAPANHGGPFPAATIPPGEPAAHLPPETVTATATATGTAIAIASETGIETVTEIGTSEIVAGTESGRGARPSSRTATCLAGLRGGLAARRRRGLVVHRRDLGDHHRDLGDRPRGL